MLVKCLYYCIVLKCAWMCTNGLGARFQETGSGFRTQKAIAKDQTL